MCVIHARTSASDIPFSCSPNFLQRNAPSCEHDKLKNPNRPQNMIFLRPCSASAAPSGQTACASRDVLRWSGSESQEGSSPRDMYSEYRCTRRRTKKISEKPHRE